MKINETIRNHLAILEIGGNLMGGLETMELHDKIRSLIGDGITEVVINLQHVNWMNSADLGVLIGCMATMKNSNGILKLANVTKKVESLLIITQLNKIFEMYTSVEDALASMSEE
jgi:anti-sigma B factor antagonist